METQELHRGRLIDHIQLVVRDLEASRNFYSAIFDVLGIPMGGSEDSYFWADELFVSTADSPARSGVPNCACSAAASMSRRVSWIFATCAST